MINSPLFWGLLIAAVVVHWSIPERFRAWFLFAASASYAATLDWRSVVALLVLGAIFYGAQKVPLRPRYLVPGLVVIALGYISYFKYFPVYLDAVRGKIEDPQVAAAFAVAVPLGASYYTFKLIHYAVESWRKKIPPHGPDTYFAYLFFFPMFAAGPIERFENFLKNRARTPSLDAMVRGVTRLFYGLIKKLVIVDLVLSRAPHHEPRDLIDAIPVWSPALPLEFLLGGLHVLSPAFVWQYVLTQFFSAYLDFSAYSDIAVGCGLLFGVTLMENFRWPIFAPNISEFWRRWHISLLGFCQTYVYLPLLGKTRQPYLALYASMLAVALWHAGSWNYVLWGLFHATFLVVYLSWARLKRARRWKLQSRALAALGCIFTILMCSAGQAFVSTKSIGIRAAYRMLAALIGVKIMPVVHV